MKKRLVVCALSVMCVFMFCGAGSKNTLNEMSTKDVENKTATNFRITQAEGSVEVCNTKANSSYNLNTSTCTPNIYEGLVVTVGEGSSCVVRVSSKATGYLVVPENTTFTVVTPEPTWIQRLLGIEPKPRIEIIEEGTGSFYYGVQTQNSANFTNIGVRG